ncbi:MAG: dTDP-4-dehydrorhamnose reductase [bacterium]|nr:dTDP-4-dehydrorhamnose reductase [bacterium]
MVLITGGGGQLGNAIRQVFFDFGKDLVFFDKSGLDITNKEEVFKIFDKYKPNIIINCAAYNNVEQAEESIVEAYETNAFGPYLLAKTANEFGAIIVHISTDYVFGGDKDSFAESDCPSPVNVYGASKLAGEQLVRLANENSFIIRTSWLFGKNKNGSEKNFVKTMLEKIKDNKQIKVVEDQIGSPTYASDLAKKIYELLVSGAKPGIYHITNSGHCSWYEFAKKIFATSGIEVEVVPIKTSESGTKIRRPKNSVLENKRLLEIDLPILRDWESALGDYLQEITER